MESGIGLVLLLDILHGEWDGVSIIDGHPSYIYS